MKKPNTHSYFNIPKTSTKSNSTKSKSFVEQKNLIASPMLDSKFSPSLTISSSPCMSKRRQIINENINLLLKYTNTNINNQKTSEGKNTKNTKYTKNTTEI